MTKKRLTYFFILLLLLLWQDTTQTLQAQSIKTTISSNNILIGEQIRYEIIIQLASDEYKVDFGIPDSIPHFDIIHQQQYDTANGNVGYLLRQHILLTSFDSGVWKFPAFPITVSAPNKASMQLLSDSFMVQVGYLPADSTGQLRDIKPVMEVFVVNRTWVFIGIAFIVTLLLGIVLYRFLKKQFSKPTPLFKNSVSAYAEAMQSLKELQMPNARDAASVKVLYSSLTYIFKKYYSRKNNRNLLSKTSGEVLLLLQTQVSSTNLVAKAAQLMRSSDAVKFAKYLPDDIENEQMLELT
ncbi:MAG: hypothetical protein WD135_01860, partial [Ferruginibacter sp.]